ncbi:hypothetical protein MtrunA17_Chr6g0474771 [Medicago truncatula]|uniref:Uncharacterized protein n=1 Tax=Medicago truncatula TaxID=3880 RepID=A0A396HHD8_MEDTR|nr:hypothetical protein MtrunA17_Chr6g0474771 [Medicago truncatula]
MLSYHCLTGPLANNPVTDFEKAVNKLRQKYRSYIVEYDTEEGF